MMMMMINNTKQSVIKPVKDIPVALTFMRLLFICNPSAFSSDFVFSSDFFLGSSFTGVFAGFVFRIISNNPSSLKKAVLHAYNKKTLEKLIKCSNREKTRRDP